MAKEKYNITGMSCAACSAKVERVVGKLDGVENVSVNLLTNSMQVEYKEDKLSSNNKKYSRCRIRSIFGYRYKTEKRREEYKKDQ